MSTLRKEVLSSLLNKKQLQQKQVLIS